MSRPSRKTRVSTTSPARAAAVLAGAVVAGTVYATGWERNAFTLRRHSLPLLAPGSRPLTILHVSDLHMMPGQKRKQQFVNSLAVTFSLGLLYPWAKVRMVEYVLKSLTFVPAGNIEELAGAGPAVDESAVGESAADFFDFDIGLGL